MRKLLLTVVLTGVAFNASAQLSKLGKKRNIDAGKKLVKAATLSDEEMAALSLQSVRWMDENNPIAEDGSPYAERLKKIVAGHESEDGLTLNFKAYNVVDVNAFATPDGSVRVMAGLMDLMTDDEIRSVIGHEIGHVKLGHSKKRYQTAYTVSGVKDLAAANTGAGAVLADGDVGKFMENVFNAQFSQSNESASDKYGFEFMVKNNYDYHAMSGAFQKLADLSGDGGKGKLTSSHPGSAKRSKRAKGWAKKQDSKK